MDVLVNARDESGISSNALHSRVHGHHGAALYVPWQAVSRPLRVDPIHLPNQNKKAKRRRCMNTCAQKAQIARINRKLARGHYKLCTSRGCRQKSNLGEHYILNTWHNIVVASRNVKPDQVEADLKSGNHWWEPAKHVEAA